MTDPYDMHSKPMSADELAERQAVTDKPDEAVKVTDAGIFPRIVSHDEAQQAAKNFIDAHFNNKDGKGVYISIPAKDDNDDLILSDYIKQQRARDTHRTATEADLRAQLATARDALAMAINAFDAANEELPISRQMRDFMMPVSIESEITSLEDARKALAALDQGVGDE